MGWHCAGCGRPSSYQGHAACFAEMSVSWERIETPDQEVLNLVWDVLAKHQTAGFDWIVNAQAELLTEGFRLVDPQYMYRKGEKAFSDGVHWAGIESIRAD